MSPSSNLLPHLPFEFCFWVFKGLVTMVQWECALKIVPMVNCLAFTQLKISWALGQRSRRAKVLDSLYLPRPFYSAASEKMALSSAKFCEWQLVRFSWQSFRHRHLLWVRTQGLIYVPSCAKCFGCWEKSHRGLLKLSPYSLYFQAYPCDRSRKILCFDSDRVEFLKRYRCMD